MKSLSFVIVVVAAQLAMACPASTESPSARYENPKGQGVTLTSYTSVKPTYTTNSQYGAGADSNQYAAPVVHKQKARAADNNE